LRGLSSGKAFRAKFEGTCRACRTRYGVGELIYGIGKGHGAIHERCRPTYGLTTTIMTPEQQASMQSRGRSRP
jgi:hypothetical protein